MTKPKNEAASGEEWREFYERHRGGSGNIVLVSVFTEHGLPDRLGVFGSIESAEAWAETFGDEVQIVFSPHVVDEPEFGNATRN